MKEIDTLSREEYSEFIDKMAEMMLARGIGAEKNEVEWRRKSEEARKKKKEEEFDPGI